MSGIAQAIKDLLPADADNSYWGKVKEVRFDDGVCDVTLEVDELDVFDVLLGLGNNKMKPKAGARCFIVRAEQQEQYFIMWCEEVEGWWFNGDGHGGFALTKKIAERLKRVEDELEELKTQYNTHVHTGVTTGPGSSGPPPQLTVPALNPRTNQDYISSTILFHG